MKEELRRVQIGEEVYFSSIQDQKFKHNSITVHLITPLDPETVTSNAILPFLLRKGSRNCPDFTKLEQTLCDLYGASLSADVSKIGRAHV